MPSPWHYYYLTKRGNFQKVKKKEIGIRGTNIRKLENDFRRLMRISTREENKDIKFRMNNSKNNSK